MTPTRERFVIIEVIKRHRKRRTSGQPSYAGRKSADSEHVEPNAGSVAKTATGALAKPAADTPPAATGATRPSTPSAPSVAGGAARRAGTPAWLLKASVESIFIIVSILLALAVDSWHNDAENRALARESLEIFEREIRLNAARVADIVPYNIGLRDVVAEMAAEPERVVEMQSIVEGLEPTFLLSTAWETALATGALRHLDVQTVSALSWTYSQQQRFREESRAGLPRLRVTAGMTEEERLEQIHQAHAYLSSISRLEQDLHVAFLEAIRQIEITLGDRAPGDTGGALTVLE
jgi:hypothetical protein